MSPFLPIASTSRIPYTAPKPLPTVPSRFFSTTPPCASPTRRTSHLIHPLLRQRLTNLTFLLAGTLSVLTVSLGMSGTFGEGAAPGCPARSRAGVALDQERVERVANERENAPRREKESWWKTKGRFLDDPVVAAPPVTAPRIVQARSTSLADQGERSEADERGCMRDDLQKQDERQPSPGRGDRRTGWTGWLGTGERVV
ncbi:hypothetical protein NBRC10512_004901 [Rhodotorula toruloides]|uniref:RHTO0S01e12354g1_1 n=2 Tax=Rhodotorula toruloides TaxID=5286 RepID=A0A061AET0_RHOTO|nr:uncharacterized protein RHTO_04710 [Rhodotorula toruloides NP11]EMS24531.1 hypothetical protein RHTO_04710 [Rhodotorula toruloides NP11]KAJ8297069.1 hypothetical protein OF846_000318 [Rhodotorula toruloides]CDR36017.1 RHTO0S01e12354g1_1 [Rhodotorula toruloides]